MPLSDNGTLHSDVTSQPFNIVGGCHLKAPPRHLKSLPCHLGSHRPVKYNRALSGPEKRWGQGLCLMLGSSGRLKWFYVFHILPQIHTANHATFPV